MRPEGFTRQGCLGSNCIQRQSYGCCLLPVIAVCRLEPLMSLHAAKQSKKTRCRRCCATCTVQASLVTARSNLIAICVSDPAIKPTPCRTPGSPCTRRIMLDSFLAGLISGCSISTGSAEWYSLMAYGCSKSASILHHLHPGLQRSCTIHCVSLAYRSSCVLMNRPPSPRTNTWGARLAQIAGVTRSQHRL